MYNLKVFGKNLKRWRNFRGLTQEQLGAKVSLTKYTISNVEVGKQKNLGLTNVISFCEALNVKIEELFFEDPKVKY